MNTIRLHGSLAKHFGKEYRMDVQNVREAFIALCSQLEGFEARVRKGAFRIVRRKGQDETGIDERTLDLNGQDCIFEIYPAMVGGKSGVGKVLLGMAIIGIAIVAAPGAIAAIGVGGASFSGAMGAGIGFMGLTYGGIAAFGAMMAFGGLAMMFAPSPHAQKTTGGGAADNTSSFIVQGPVNTMYQGVSVPLVYGETITGSGVIRSALVIDLFLISGGGSTTGGAGTGSGTTTGGGYGGVGGSYDAGDAYDQSGFPDYPQATSGVGGTGLLGTRSLGDIGLVKMV
jgi:predicted phage tail protein